MTTTTTKKSPSAPSARALPPAFSATLSATKKCAFCARRNECRAICGKMFGFCNADFLLDADRVSEALRLARRVDAFARAAVGFWDYADAVEAAGSRAAMIREDAALLLDGDGGIDEMLEEYATDGPEKYARRAARLLRSVRAFCNESRKY